MNKIAGKVVGNTTATPMSVPDWKQTDETKADYIKNKPFRNIGEITNLYTGLLFALNKKENEYVTFTTKGMLTKSNNELIIGGATAQTETASYTAFSLYQGEDASECYYKQIYIFDSNYNDTFGIYTKGVIFDSNGTGVTTTYSRFVAFEDYINALQLTVSGNATFNGGTVFNDAVRFNGIAPYFQNGFVSNGTPAFYEGALFQKTPEIVDYRGQKEADFMVIKDLGEIIDYLDIFVNSNSKTSEWYTFTLSGNKIIMYLVYDLQEPSDKDHSYTVYAQYNGEDADGGYYKTFFVFDSMHYGDTPFGLLVKSFRFDANGDIERCISTKFMFEDNIACSGPAWFANTPKIGGTSYNDPTAEDVMSIRDLGELTTQAQLDNLVTLSSGNYKFTSPYELTVNTNGQFKFSFIETESTATTYNYEMYVISDGTYYRQDVCCDKISRKMYRQGNINFATYAGYILDSENDIEFNEYRDAKILSNYGLSIESSNMLNLNGNNVMIGTNNTLWIEAGQMYFVGTGMKLFQAPPKIMHPQNKSVWADVAYGMTYSTVDNTSEVTETIYTYTLATDKTYLNTVDSLTITITEPVIANADGLTTGMHFNTGDTAPTVTYTINGDTVINWQGTDCALDDGVSVFAPSANMHYDIYITYMGGNVVGIVKGYKPATSNQ